MTSAKWHITPMNNVFKCLKPNKCKQIIKVDHYLNRDEAIKVAHYRIIANASKEKKRISKLPSYITSFFQLNMPPPLPTQQANELAILEKFLKHEVITPDQIRFGDDGAFEPDFVIKEANQLIGVEITEIYGSKEIAVAYKTPHHKVATEEQWLRAIEDRYNDKLSDRKDGSRYDRSKFNQIILLMEDRSGRGSITKFSSPLQLLPNGTPVCDATLFQQLFQPWSNVIDESYLLRASSTNQLGTILAKGHLN